MTPGEILILTRLDAIEKRLAELFVPVLTEENRQYISAPREVRTVRDRALLKRKRAEFNQKERGTA